MDPTGQTNVFSRRLAAYGYLAPLIAGKRVLEVGVADGAGAVRLRSLGAVAVLGVDADERLVAAARARGTHEGVAFRGAGSVHDLATAAAGPFDVVVIPDWQGAMRPGVSADAILQWRRVLAPDGYLVCLAPSGDKAGSIPGQAPGFYDLVETLEPVFARVRMYGVTPFAAFGIAEFDEAVGGLRVDAGLVDESAIEPTHYLAVAGPDKPLALGYALLQVPGLPGSSVGTQAAVASAPVDTDHEALRQRVEAAESTAAGALRVSRAQTEEIEELRGRLRRGAESRAQMDEEAARLRRALAEADESVMNLTRRTAEEMTSLAQQITAGLRQGGARSSEPSRDEMAARESALSDRDERIAGLEAEKQELLWRVGEIEARGRTAEARVKAAESARAEAETARAAAEKARGKASIAAFEAAAAVAVAVVPVRAVPVVPVVAAPAVVAPVVTAPVVAAPAVVPVASAERLAWRAREAELVEQIKTRSRAVEQYAQAGTVHQAEVQRLRAAVTEQATLVAELEEQTAKAVARAAELESESARLRKQVAEGETAERTRRSRLSELEGTLLRMKAQAAMTAETVLTTQAVLTAQAVSVVRSEGPELAVAQARISEVSDQNAELGRQVAAARVRINDLEQAVVEGEGRIAACHQDREKLTARLVEAEMSGAGSARLESSLHELTRLREDLERAEDKLWESKGQLLLDRERIAVLESQLAACEATRGHGQVGTISEAAHLSIVQAALNQLAELETSVRAEVAELRAIERALEDNRVSQAVGFAAAAGSTT